MRQLTSRLTCAAALIALNAWICWRLFSIEYLNQMGSIEGAFISLARVLRDHWPDVSWWPVWNCGMPYQNTYQPLMHLVTAALSAKAHISAPHAYHFVLATAYSLGPAALFLLALRLTGDTAGSFCAGLAYSLISPSAFLSSAIREDLGGFFLARRLHSAVVYGDGPQVAALTLVPLALASLDLALARRTPASYLLCSCLLASVVLTNIPGAMVLGLAVAAYGLTQPREDAIRRSLTMAGLFAFSYCLAAYWFPPSTIATMLRNTRDMVPENAMPQWRLPYLALSATLAAALAIAMATLRAPRHLRFFLLFFFFAAVITLGYYWFDISLIAQSNRFHLGMEMGLIPTLVLSLRFAAMRWRRLALPLAALFAFGCAMQIYNYRYSARRLLRTVEVSSTSEYKTSRWLDQHAGGLRSFVPGSTAFWFNNFTDTPQITGCCDQGLIEPGARVGHYIIGTDDGAGNRAYAISLAWLQALGAQFVAVSGPHSTEFYKDFHDPGKFAGKLQELWRDGDDAIYAVPQASKSLAHVVYRNELIQRFPANGLDTQALETYVAAIEDRSRPSLDMRWINNHEAVISGVVEAGQWISVQIPYHAGWRGPTPIHKDGFDYMAIDPQCRGACSIRLSYDGGWELKLLGPVSLLSSLGGLLWIGWRKWIRNGRGSVSETIIVD